MPAAISDVSICNGGLIKLGADTITSLDQDTKNARLCKARFALLRNMVLESHPWKFATKVVELPSIDGTPELDYTYQFALPADYICMQRADDWKIDFEVFNDVLYANYAPLKIKYTFENTNTGMYTYSFAEVLSWRIAADLAYAITNSTTVADLMIKGYEAELRVARFNSAKNQSPQGPIADTFIDVRF